MQQRWIQSMPEEKPSKAALAAQIIKETKKDVVPEPEPKKSLWQRFKHEMVHYWHGSKLLAKEVRITSRLFWKSTVKGQQLTRREHKQLVRTTADIFRLVPMLVFVLVPFMEFALPIALRLFPNMLPSTFETKFQEVRLSFSG
jgi:LETM1 and EF-hand domain-containing protein 1